MPESQNVRDYGEAIDERLATVVDPGAGLDVKRMGLVRDLVVSDAGEVSFTFKPASPLCPMAFSLAPAIKEAIESIPGISRVLVHVENFNRAEELERLLQESGDGT